MRRFYCKSVSRIQCMVGAAYDVENGAVRVAGVLVLGGVSDKTLVIGKGDPGWCDTVT
jgi:hypothetical protein